MNNLFKDLIKNDWLDENEVEDFLSDSDFVRAIKRSTSPILENIFNALYLVPLSEVKVLILGQDPYPNPLHAHGLAFSSKNKTTPGSLRNIFKAIDAVYGSNLVEQKNNDLTPWAKDGVLLLNTSLTYKNTFDNSLSANENKKLQAKEKKFHMAVWAGFIDKIINKLLNRNKKLVMLLWGGDAYNIVIKNINDQNLQINECENGKIMIPGKNILILHTDHPSQVKINLGGKFLEHAPTHFKECNDFLGDNAIHWTNL